MRFDSVCCWLALTFVLTSSLALAQTEPSATAPLTVWVDTHGARFDKARLQAALMKELKRPVVLTDDAGVAAVQVRLESATRAAVRYTTPSGEELSRSVDLPKDGERSVLVVSWLTVNMVRDEAAELLGELRARHKEAAEARAAADKAAADEAAADKAAADKAAADKAAADKVAAAAARTAAERAKTAENTAGGPPKQADAEDPLLRDPLHSFDLALTTPLSLIRDSKKRELSLQLAFLYGEAGGMLGVGASLGVLRVRRDVLGVEAGMVASIVDRNARGAVLSVGYAQLGGNLDGMLGATGLAWHRGKRARGAVLSAGATIAGELEGATTATLFTSVKSLDGVAVAGGANVVRGSGHGVLVAGGVNVSREQHGLEIAGGVNTAREQSGLSIASMNVHRHVRGVQLGLLNIAEQVDGAALGVISISKNGRVQPVTWVSNDRNVHVGIKSIAGYAFTQIGVSLALAGDAFAYDAGLGGHFGITQNLFVEPGVHYSAEYATQDPSGAPDEQQLHYLGQLGYRVGNKLDLLGAVGVRHTIAGGSGAKAAPELRAGIAFF